MEAGHRDTEAGDRKTEAGDRKALRATQRRSAGWSQWSGSYRRLRQMVTASFVTDIRHG
jgi:hypothetical protein